MQIIQTILFTNNLQRTEVFYSNVLCLPVVQKTNTSITFAAGYSQLVFRLAQKVNGIYHFAFLIPANCVQQAYDWVKQ